MGEVVLRKMHEERCRKDSLACGSFFCALNTLDKFLDDKTLFEKDNYIVIAEGVLSAKLREDILTLFDEGITIGKTQAIIVLAAIDYYLD